MCNGLLSFNMAILGNGKFKLRIWFVLWVVVGVLYVTWI
jgi:hypothetical protein